MDRITDLSEMVNIVHNITDSLPRLQMQIGVTKKSRYLTDGSRQMRIYELLGAIYDVIVYHDWIEEEQDGT